MTTTQYTAKPIYDEYGSIVIGNSEDYILLYRYDYKTYKASGIDTDAATILQQVFIKVMSKVELDSAEVEAILDANGIPLFEFDDTGVINVVEG